MKGVKRECRASFKNQQGAGLVEFALLVALLVLVALPAVRHFGDKTAESFCESAAQVGNIENLSYHGEGDCSVAVGGGGF